MLHGSLPLAGAGHGGPEKFTAIRSRDTPSSGLRSRPPRAQADMITRAGGVCRLWFELSRDGEHRGLRISASGSGSTSR